jgi:hypothetical protein
VDAPLAGVIAGQPESNSVGGLPCDFGAPGVKLVPPIERRKMQAVRQRGGFTRMPEFEGIAREVGARHGKEREDALARFGGAFDQAGDLVFLTVGETVLGA